MNQNGIGRRYDLWFKPSRARDNGIGQSATCGEIDDPPPPYTTPGKMDIDLRRPSEAARDGGETDLSGKEKTVLVLVRQIGEVKIRKQQAGTKRGMIIPPILYRCLWGFCGVQHPLGRLNVREDTVNLRRADQGLMDTNLHRSRPRPRPRPRPRARATPRPEMIPIWHHNIDASRRFSPAFDTSPWQEGSIALEYHQNGQV
ncbi:hypothetical protein IAR55_007140 [Kwoniella newhampshirensis]|uniref:Uncharacterized protein n=1 Tax=Kwoniella newhampshirensis TaxID=1651941 RepID=A0AAW0YT27_9TREE